ncbi:MAG: restriction endonuclease [Nitrososphaerales archaeon]|nr:restriction endonuclease [Nitrososphaerales archaeon]
MEMASRCGLDPEALLEALRFLEVENIARIDGKKVRFEKGSRVLSSVLTVKLGSSIEEVSKFLSWKDFEELVSFVMASNNYRVYRNFRLKHPRMEIDVLAVRDMRGLAIDCKHWHHTVGLSGISKVARAQIKRSEELVKSEKAGRLGMSYAIPLIVTLYSERVILLDGVPVVPIDKFSGLLNELDGMLDTILIIR